MIKTTIDKSIITRENDKVKEDEVLAHLSDQLLVKWKNVQQ